jgi:CobQ-like glutamine amidotransferase family enzyme
VQFAGFNIDTAFGNCVDGLVIVDLARLKAARRERYIGTTPAA